MNHNLLLMLVFPPLMVSASNDVQIDFLNQFVQGDYTLVGKAINSNKTYHGSVTISQQDGELRVKRSIDDKQTLGTSAIEAVAGDGEAVLRMRFTENNTQYEETCMIDSDLDNYARISCYLYFKSGKTKQPGLETFFIKHL